MFLRKTKKSVVEVAENLVGFAFDPHDIEAAANELPHTVIVNSTCLQHELRILRVLAVDFGITLVFPNGTREKDAVAASYFKTLHSFVEDLPHELNAVFMADLAKKFDEYGFSAKQNPSNDPFAAIGRLFARNCGLENDKDLAEYAKKQFGSTANGVRQWLMKIHVVL